MITLNEFFNYYIGSHLLNRPTNLEQLSNWLYLNYKLLRHIKSIGALTDKQVVIKNQYGNELFRLPASKFLCETEAILKAINESPSGSRSFTVAQPQVGMDRIYCPSPKANSSDTTDILIVLHDQRTRINNDMEYSIKSRLGGSSTLINSAGDSTNFVYSLGKVSNHIISEFNSLDRFKKKFELLSENSICPKWIGVDSRTFYNNLMMIDTCMPWIIGECLVYYYSGKARTLGEAESLLKTHNPLKFDIENQPNFYEYKLKQFLLSFALGMTAATPWNGKFIANGGYIVVKEDGEIVCYHFFDRNELEDYLFNNTYFDTPSTKRHNFGYIYTSNSEDLIKLNLQVRFIS